MFRYIRVTQKGLILVLLPLIFELLFVGVLAQQLVSTAAEFNKLRYYQKALYKTFSLAETVFTSSMLVLNFQNESPEERVKAADRIIYIFSRPAITDNSPVESTSEMQELFEETESSRKMILDECEKIKSLAKENQLEAYTNKDRDRIVMCGLSFRTTYEKIKALASQLERNEPTEFKRMSTNLLTFLALGFTVSCASSFLVAYVLTFDIVRRLRLIAGNAYLVAAGKESPAPQAGTDEIAELDKSLYKTSQLLKASQKKELVILNNAAEVVCSLDRQLRFVAVSASSEKLWGYLPDDLLGRSLVTILTGDTAADAQPEFEHAESSGLDTNITTIVKCKSGMLKDSMWTVNWSKESEEFVCVVHDITELKKIEKLKQAFFSMVSHDLRAPLTSININLANMTSGNYGEIPKGGEKLVNNSVQSAQRLTALVNDLLELDKLNSGKLALDLECISARDVCEAGISALESMATNAGVELVAPSGDAAVIADERRLVQVITNLISNAIKFSPRNSKVIVRISRHGEQVEFSVADQGPGISLELQSQLFEKFSQGTATSNVAIKGTGLGLAIVKSIVVAHDGEVGVESEPEKGSTFWVRIREFVD